MAVPRNDDNGVPLDNRAYQMGPQGVVAFIGQAGEQTTDYVLDKPTGLTVVSGSSGVLAVDFNAVTNAEEYTVRFAKVSTPTVIDAEVVRVNSDSFNQSGLVSGENYYVDVRAECNNNMTIGEFCTAVSGVAG